MSHDLHIKRGKLEAKAKNMLNVATLGSWEIINKFAFPFLAIFPKIKKVIVLL